jgi:hypothetical protein
MESRKRYGIGGMLASAVALIALVAALTPGAQAAGTFTACANKPIKFQIEDGTGGTQPYTTVVKAISVKGTTCANAYEFLRQSYNQEKISSTGYPQNFKCKNGEFTTPLGYLPTICSKGGKTIKYGAQGG